MSFYFEFSGEEKKKLNLYFIIGALQPSMPSSLFCWSIKPNQKSPRPLVPSYCIILCIGVFLHAVWTLWRHLGSVCLQQGTLEVDSSYLTWGILVHGALWSEMQNALTHTAHKKVHVLSNQLSQINFCQCNFQLTWGQILPSYLQSNTTYQKGKDKSC